MSTVRRIYARRGTRYLLTGTLLLVVMWRIHPHRLLDGLAAVRPGLFLWALVLTVPFITLKALRWHAMLLAAGVDATFREATVSLVGGMGLALVTPARLGELVRVAYLRDPRKWKIGGLVMLDKGFDVLVLTGLSIPGAWRLLGPVPGVLFSLATVVGLSLVFDPRTVLAKVSVFTRALPFRDKVESVSSSAEILRPRSTLVFLLFTLLSFVVVLAQFGILLLNWHSWSFSVVLLTFPLVVLTNVVPLTVGGLGIREGTAAILLSHYGVPAADAALAAFLMFAINTALPGVLGTVLLPTAGAQSQRLEPLDSPKSTSDT